MIPDDVGIEIMRRLVATEQTEGVRILLAIESGSRAWGFESPDSDFDVRFIYARTPNWYLAVDLEEQRDVIEYPIVDAIDLNGWDVRKALRLFWKSNPTFVEWIQSPIVYLENGPFANGARQLLPLVYSTVSGIFHYRNMARTNFREHLLTETVPLKKYFYVLRALLSIRWIEQFGTAAPIEFEKLMPLLESRADCLSDILELLAKKRETPELGRAAAIRSIHHFIEEELYRLETIAPAAIEKPNVIQRLNTLFREAVAQS